MKCIYETHITEVEVHMTKIMDNNRFTAYLTNHLLNSIYKRKGTIDPMDNYDFHESFGWWAKIKGHVTRQFLRENFTNHRTRVPVLLSKTSNILPGLRAVDGKDKPGHPIA